MNKSTKILVAGVGGQGVVFLTNLIVKAALLAELPVATSEIHGLAQRGGSVSAGITIGANTYGFIEEGGVDLLIGLEPLEAQRCASFLNINSCAVISSSRILPHSVNSGYRSYPDIEKFIQFLEQNIEKVIYTTETPKGIKAILVNLYLLGRACKETHLPIKPQFIEKAIEELAREGFVEKSLEAFKQGYSSNGSVIETG